MSKKLIDPVFPTERFTRDLKPFAVLEYITPPFWNDELDWNSIFEPTAPLDNNL